ncbi:MAG TPA: DUF58 domain-containing protein, partial [Pilimelia sp.]|nr:DUF58 domain-containing protein [Pilimelia sp.]
MIPALRPAAPVAPPPRPPEPDPGPEWRATRALGRAVLLAGLLLLGAVVLGRPDLVVLAAPFALGAAVALRRRPGAVPRLRWALADDAAVAEGDRVRGQLTVENADDVPYDLVVARLLADPWLPVRAVPAGCPDDVGPAGAARSSGTGAGGPDPGGAAPSAARRRAALRWGRHRIGPVAARADPV